MTADVLGHVRRDMCEDDPLYFMRYFFKHRMGSKMIVAPHHEVIMRTMKRVIRYAEQHPPFKATYQIEREHTLRDAISSSVINMAESIKAKAIVAETKTGAIALQISSRRPEEIILAVTDEDRTAQQLAIVYGVKSFVRPADPQAASKLTDWLKQEGLFKSGDVVVSVSGNTPGTPGTTDTIKVRALE